MTEAENPVTLPSPYAVNVTGERVQTLAAWAEGRDPDKVRDFVAAGAVAGLTNMKNESHAVGNAVAHLATMVDAFAAIDALDDGAESATFDGETFDDEEDVRERLQESPLSIMVRGAWRSAGERDRDPPAEYEILLSTGGPALRIRGELDRGEADGEPRLEFQDWGTPWTPLIVSEAERAILTRFAGLFWFGDA